MSSKARIVLAGVVVLILGILLLPRLARRIDSTLDPMWERAAIYEAQYRDMTNAFPIASEVMPDHPTRRLWEERKTALMAAGYIETREIPMPHPLTRKGAVEAFFKAFQSRFPGVECSIRRPKIDQPSAVVTARKTDLGPAGSIERFLSRYDPGK